MPFFTLLLLSQASTQEATKEEICFGKLDPLDELLSPLIYESVRRQFLIRSAKERGNIDELDTLECKKSRKQMAKENIALAREEGEGELAAMWNKEDDFYWTLRADATQDEGSYSRFLDLVREN